MVIEGKINLTKECQELVDFTLGYDLAWFYQKSIDDDPMIFAHVLMHRDSENKPVKGNINSAYYFNFEKIVLDTCKENNIEVNNILRMSLNNTQYHSKKMGRVHIDHEIPHYNFLWYINDFTEGSTYLFEDNLKTMKQEIKTEKNKFVIFDGIPHAQGFCSAGQNRIILVATFN